MKKIFSTVFVLISTVACVGCALQNTAPDYRKNASDRRSLTEMELQFLASEYKFVYKIEDLPTGIQKKMDQKLPRMVNPGEYYNDTDMVVSESIPFAQLTWAGVSGNKVFVFYKVGGFIPRDKLLIASVDRDRIESISLTIRCNVHDLPTLKYYVRAPETQCVSNE